MTALPEDRRSPQASNGLLVVLILGFTVVAAGLLSFSDFSGKDQGNLIRGLSEFRVTVTAFSGLHLRHSTKLL